MEQHGLLSEDEKRVLREITSRTKDYKAHDDIVQEGSSPAHSCLIIEGFAIRHRHLEDGRRQITAFHIPGDFADLHSFLLKKMDDGVGALTPCTVAHVAHSDLQRVTKEYPYLARLLWFSTLVDGAVHRAWITAIGAMDARERLAHFLCEICDRLKAMGMLKDESYTLPITQEVLGNAFGLSSVHVNRMLGDLRAEGLITLKGRNLAICDWQALRRVAHYSPDYLHIGEQVARD